MSINVTYLLLVFNIQVKPFVFNRILINLWSPNRQSAILFYADFFSRARDISLLFKTTLKKEGKVFIVQ